MTSQQDFYRTELSLSARPVLLIFAGLSFGLLLLVETSLSDEALASLLYMDVFILLLCVPVWLVHGNRPELAKLLALLLIESAICYGYLTLHMTGFLSLLPLVPALAVAMSGGSAGAVFAAGETFLVLFTMRADATGSGGVMASVLAIICIWSIVLILDQLIKHLMQVNQWAQDYVALAHGLIEEQRDRRLELSQTMADLHNANEQLTRMNVMAHGLRRAADDSRLAKERFVANVSHELRTPLNMIIGFSRLILEMPKTYGESIPSSLLADLSVVHRNAEHLSSLVDDVLDLSQLEAERFALTRGEVDLLAIIDAAVEATRPLFESKNLYVRLDTPQELLSIVCDEARIREVMLNLLSNAGRFTDQGGVTITVASDGQFATVGVADTGAGIAQEDAQKVFAPFQQVDDSIRRRHGGTGLGLTISKNLVELHGGKMWFDSEPMSGSTFYFTLPMSAPMGQERDPLSWFGPYSSYQVRTRPSRASAPVLLPRMAVLDPSGAMQRLLERYLTGYKIISVSSVRQIVEDVSIFPVGALLINELATPAEARQIGAVPLPQGMPVIGCAIAGVPGSVRSLGVNDYLVKPVSREAMLAALDKLDLDGGTLLLVDDDPETTRLFRRMLISAGRDYRVLRAEDGEQALRIARENRVDAILMDLVMPNTDGFQFLAERRVEPELERIPVIVVSAQDPAGQPIVSNGLSLRREGGLAAPQLLQCISEISRMLSPVELAAAPEPQGDRHD